MAEADGTRVESTSAPASDSAVEEPLALCCPITHLLFRDPVFVAESGSTYERHALETFWGRERSGAVRDPLTNVPLSSRATFVNWGKRREVASWLADHSTHVPAGWASRDDVPPAHPAAASSRAAARARAALARRLPAGASLRALACVAGVVLALAAGLDLPLALFPAGAWRPARAAGARAPWTERAGGGDGAAARAGGSGGEAAPPPPRGSRLVLHERLIGHARGRVRGGPAGRRELSIHRPRCRLGELRGTNLGASVFALGFTATWTMGAYRAGAPLLFVLFSCPFWLTAARLLRGALAPLLEASTVHLSTDELVLRSELGLTLPTLGVHVEARARELRAPYAALTAVRLAPAPDGSEDAALAFSLDYVDGIVAWGQGLSAAELRWVCACVRDVLVELEHDGALGRAEPDRGAARLRPELVTQLAPRGDATDACALPPPARRAHARLAATELFFGY
ncbi:hypothetical protein KFE25_001787 [Diacronema lutheri]|uniref:U-box domain-containing protein n=2 Tax=Diacronema lutheri TaxID=2081491 RepID=A0A8J6C7R3_DIALT|nr:hypothetical protein KFE25_001787 [Diacronema lutheri]